MLQVVIVRPTILFSVFAIKNRGRNWKDERSKCYILILSLELKIT